jgi:hypothetical protein
MVDDPALVKRPHLLVVMLVLIENPLETGHSLACFYLSPNLALQQNLTHQFLVVIPLYNQKARFVAALIDPQLLLLGVLGVVFAVAKTRATREAGRVEPVG